MTLQFKTGDWVRLRKGSIEQIESINSRTLAIRLKGWVGDHTASGYYWSEDESPLDIIAVIDAPETLPEPFEMFCNVYDDGDAFAYLIKEKAMNVKRPDAGTYRCTVTPIELVKP